MLYWLLRQVVARTVPAIQRTVPDAWWTHRGSWCQAMGVTFRATRNSCAQLELKEGTDPGSVLTSVMCAPFRNRIAKATEPACLHGRCLPPRAQP